MSLIRLKNITKKYGERAVLRDVFFRMAEGERVGLIGRNGSGKTTLLRLILGQEHPDAGSVDLDEGLRIGYFSQFSQLDVDMSVQQVLEEVLSDIRAVEAELKEIELAFEGSPPPPEETERLLARQAELLEIMEHRDGWTWTNRIDTVLSRLGFSEEHRHGPIHQLSGGWRNRAALAKILLEDPDILLMDEPTNYLDLDGTEWLEEYFRKFHGGLLLVSHDRHFLDKVVTRVVELENYHTHEYAGNFTEYVREKQFRMKTLESQFQHEEELLVFESEAIADRKEAARHPADYIKRKLANIKKSVQPRPADEIVTSLYENLRVPEMLCEVENLAKRYHDTPLFDRVSFQLRRGDRVAIVGPNGCGKSTLLRVLLREEPPDAGRLDWRSGVHVASFNDMLAALENDTILARVIDGEYGIVNRAPRKQVARFWHMMQFSEMDLRQKVGALSGGQRARVALAQCLLSGAAALVLDEPTNHLDLTSTQVMERAMVHFPGAIIVATHDRFFIDKVATRLLLFESPGSVRVLDGNFTTWHASAPPGI